MISDEDKKGNSHDGTHDDQKKKHGFHHEHILKSQHITASDNRIPNSEIPIPKPHIVQKLQEGDRPNNRKIKTPNRMHEQKTHKVLIVFLADTLSDPIYHP